MALIGCIECGSVVSDAAPACNHCGRLLTTDDWSASMVQPGREPRGDDSNFDVHVRVSAVDAFSGLWSFVTHFETKDPFAPIECPAGAVQFDPATGASGALRFAHGKPADLSDGWLYFQIDARPERDRLAEALRYLAVRLHRGFGPEWIHGGQTAGGRRTGPEVRCFGLLEYPAGTASVEAFIERETRDREQTAAAPPTHSAAGAGRGARDSRACDLCGAAVAMSDEIQHLLGHARDMLGQPSDEQAAFAGMSALHRAAASGDGAAVTAAVALGQDVNARDKDGWTPLFYAAHAASFDACVALLEAGANPALRAMDGSLAWQYGREEIGSFLGEILAAPFPDLRQSGFTYRQLAEPYRRFRTARMAGSPIPEAARMSYFLAVLDETRPNAPASAAGPAAHASATAGRGDAPRASWGRDDDAEERVLREFEVHWGHLMLTNHGLWLASQREIGSDFRFDSSVGKVPWQDVGGVRVQRRGDPDSFRPWARKHVVAVSVRGSDDLTIWCKSEDQAYEIAAAIDRDRGRA